MVARILTAIAAIWMWTGGAAHAVTNTLDVTVTYLERLALPPNATVYISLQDVSLMDVASVPIAAQRFRISGVPVQLTLPYDAEVIDTGARYTVSARIEVDRKVLFRTTRAYPVITYGADRSVELVLDRMPSSRAPASPPPLLGTVWEVVDLAAAPIPSGVVPTLTLTDDGGVAVFAGCNRFRGRAVVDGNALSFPPAMAGTLMACPEALSVLERDVVSAIEAVMAFRQDGASLELLDASDKVVMTLRAGG